MAQLYEQYNVASILKSSDEPNSALNMFNWIKNKCLHNYYQSQLDDRLLVERILDTCNNNIINNDIINNNNNNEEEPRRRKKSVRFADTEGLILENIRVIHNQPESEMKKNLNNTQTRLDEVRNYFRQRLITQITPRWSNQIYSPQLTNRSTFVPEFVQPVTLIDFIERVRNQRVCLQSCLVINEDLYITTTLLIRVLNITYEKTVNIRYTLDNWLTYNDVNANYVKDSSDEWSDEFKAQFQINTNLMKPGEKVYFAISYTTPYQTYWDNNCNNNYSLVYRV